MAVPAVAKRLEGDGGRTQAVGPGLTVIPEGKGGGVQHRLQAPAWAYAVIPGHICSENGVLPPKTPLKPPPPREGVKGARGGGLHKPRHGVPSRQDIRTAPMTCNATANDWFVAANAVGQLTQKHQHHRAHRDSHPWQTTLSAEHASVFSENPPPPCVTFRRVVAPLRGPGRSPVLPFACCVGLLLSVGRCGRCSCWCCFRVRGAQWLVCWGCGMVCRWRVSGAQ